MTVLNHGVEDEAAVAPVTARHDADDSVLLPPWFGRLLLLALAAVLGFGGGGLALAIIGIFRPATAAPVGAVLTALVTLAGWRFPHAAPADRRRASAWAAAAVALAVTSVVWHYPNASEHVVTDRDAGTYAVAGRWLATNTSLEVDAATGAFDGRDDLTAAAGGMHDAGDDDGHLHFQGGHFLPVLLATAHRVGGDDLMFRVPVLLVAVGLLAVYALAVRLTRRPWAAFAGTALFAVSLPFAAVARDTYSEAAMLPLLWGGLWLWTVAVDRGSARPALIAGLLVGATAMTRIDAVAVLIAVPIALLVLFRSRSRPPSAGPLTATFVGGVIAAVLVGVLDLRLRSTGYYADLDDEVTLLWGALGAAVVVTVAVAWASSRTQLRTVLRRHRPRLALGAGTAIALLLVAAWLVRPYVQESHGYDGAVVGFLQTNEGTELDPTRRYDEMSMVWMGWYLSPIAVASAIAGAGVISYRSVRRPDPAALLPLGALAASTAIYLWQPSITPDHVWVMRRFVAAGLPLFAVLSAIGAVAVVDAMRGRGWHPFMATSIGAAVLIVATSTAFTRTWEVREFSDQHGFLDLARQGCGAVEGGAVVVAHNTSTGAQDTADFLFAQTLRSWCDVPVMTLGNDSAERPSRLRDLARAWAAQGRSLYLLGSDPEHLESLVPESAPLSVGPVESDRFLVGSIESPPDHLFRNYWGFFVTPVPSR